MGKFKHKEWGKKERARRGAVAANRTRRTKKDFTREQEDSISKSEHEERPQAAVAQETGGPLYYRCLSCPGDVKLREPGKTIPFCRYCGFQMVRVGAVGREKRDRM